MLNTKVIYSLFRFSLSVCGVLLFGQDSCLAATTQLQPDEAISKFEKRGTSTMPVLEVATFSDLKRRHPLKNGHAQNFEAIKAMLTGGTVLQFRVSFTTESVASIEAEKPGIRRSVQVSFGPEQLFVSDRMLLSSPGSPGAWDDLASTKNIRSDMISKGTFSSDDINKTHHVMEFGSFQAFREACLTELRRPPGPRPDSWNMALDLALLDFRQYLIVQNLGHEGVAPLTFQFNGDQFSCKLLRGGETKGRIISSAEGIVEKIVYEKAGYMGARTYLLFYDRSFPEWSWFPSSILMTRETNDLYEVKMRYHILEAHADIPSLPIGQMYSEQPSTNAGRTIVWSNGTAYSLEKGGVVTEQPLLARHRKQARQ